MTQYFKDPTTGAPLCKSVDGHNKPIIAAYPDTNATYTFTSGPFDLDAPAAWDAGQNGWYAENAFRQATFLLTVDTSVFPFVWNLSVAWQYPAPGFNDSPRNTADYATYGCITGTGNYENIGTITVL